MAFLCNSQMLKNLNFHSAVFYKYRLPLYVIEVNIYIIFLFQIEKYMKNTHAKTHSSYTVDIEHIFKVFREGETERFGKVNQD